MKITINVQENGINELEKSIEETIIINEIQIILDRKGYKYTIETEKKDVVLD